jgi:tRNA pseudouridine38-40 synthase
MKPARNIRLTLAFDGSAYHGWQIQKNHVSIQGIVRNAIQTITGERVNPVGSGRTDAGTHARALVANFVTSSRIPTSSLAKALNSVLPTDIRVLSVREVPLSFHAQHSARSKIYRYQIYRGPVMPPHLAREHFHYPYPVNLQSMTRAAKIFEGTHDFASFGKAKRLINAQPASRGAEDTVRHVFKAELSAQRSFMFFTVEADGFLHHMVRRLVGTLLEVGRGRRTLEQVHGLLEGKNRGTAGFTVPAHGLVLLRVRYRSPS